MPEKETLVILVGRMLGRTRARQMEDEIADLAGHLASPFACAGIVRPDHAEFMEWLYPDKE